MGVCVCVAAMDEASQLASDGTSVRSVGVQEVQYSVNMLALFKFYVSTFHAPLKVVCQQNCLNFTYFENEILSFFLFSFPLAMTFFSATQTGRLMDLENVVKCDAFLRSPQRGMAITALMVKCVPFC